MDGTGRIGVKVRKRSEIAMLVSAKVLLVERTRDGEEVTRDGFGARGPVLL